MDDRAVSNPILPTIGALALVAVLLAPVVYLADPEGTQKALAGMPPWQAAVGGGAVLLAALVFLGAILRPPRRRRAR